MQRARLAIAGLFAGAAFFAAGATHAIPEPWMEQDQLERLAYYVTVDEECSFTAEHIERVTEGEMLRARLSPYEVALGPGGLPLTLIVKVSCLPMMIGGRVLGQFAHFGVHFALSVRARSIQDWGGSASGPNTDIAHFTDIIRVAIAAALTDYLKANLEPEPE